MPAALKVSCHRSPSGDVAISSAAGVIPARERTHEILPRFARHPVLVLKHILNRSDLASDKAGDVLLTLGDERPLRQETVGVPQVGHHAFQFAPQHRLIRQHVGIAPLVVAVRLSIGISVSVHSRIVLGVLFFCFVFVH